MENKSYYSDVCKVCQDCQSEFVFTGGEQAFYNKKGLTEPKRCPACRAKKREKFNKK